MIIEFEGEIFYWRGPAPFLFVAVPEEPSRDLKAISTRVTYGWGVIPVRVRIGKTEWKTSLFPKEGRYLGTCKRISPRISFFGMKFWVTIAGMCNRSSKD